MEKQKKIKNKFGQEEMVGFALIIILVSVILLVFLAISLNKPKTEIESYEVNSFLQAVLQYTTSCQPDSGIKKFNTIQELSFECELENKCSDGEKSCKVLNETLREILKESWQIGEERPDKGYELTINSEELPILIIKEGNLTKNCRGSSQSLPKSRTKKNFFINFEVCG